MLLKARDPYTGRLWEIETALYGALIHVIIQDSLMLELVFHFRTPGEALIFVGHFLLLNHLDLEA